MAEDAFTDRLIALAHAPKGELPVDALRMARYSLLDWMACGLAGVDAPLSHKLRAFAETEGGMAHASVFGAGRVPARMAALANGATSHALDYDDTHFAHVGHLSVGIYPAALAIGEELDATVDEVIAAFLVGAEGAIRVGLALGQAHYDLGFHQTATAGAFGATMAAARLLGLNGDQTRHALGLCATRASGVKAQFGTMGKPYNAGIAAANGVECAKLAALGMTSADDGLLGAQGFVATHAPRVDQLEMGARFLFEDNKYKLHACCHGTHAMIEALGSEGVTADDVQALCIHTNPRWLKVCDQKAPRTGLEVKFSYAWLAGMVLRGDATPDETVYSDALAKDSALADFAERVEVAGDDHLTDLQVTCVLTLKDGRTLKLAHDLADPIPLDDLARKLNAKAHAMIGDAATSIWQFAQSNGQSARQIGDMIRAR